MDDAGVARTRRCRAPESSGRSKPNDEATARSILPALVGRDPDTLDRAGMIRATVESVAENTSDGVIAPLIFLFVGGPVGAIAYKAVNTLDSMIGYRDERYLYFGRAAARIDDAANYLPARLTAICIIVAAQFVTGPRVTGVDDLSCGRALASESQRRFSGGRCGRSARHPARRRRDLWRRGRAPRVDGASLIASVGCRYRQRRAR